jgi:hypothetical protein
VVAVGADTDVVVKLVVNTVPAAVPDGTIDVIQKTTLLLVPTRPVSLTPPPSRSVSAGSGVVAELES